MCHAVLPKFCVFLLELLFSFLENAVNKKSDIRLFSFACYNRPFWFYQGIFFCCVFCTFRNDLCEFSIENVKNSAISGLRRDFHLVIRILTPYIIAIMYLLFGHIQCIDGLWCKSVPTFGEMKMKVEVCNYKRRSPGDPRSDRTKVTHYWLDLKIAQSFPCDIGLHEELWQPAVSHIKDEAQFSSKGTNYSRLFLTAKHIQVSKGMFSVAFLETAASHRVNITM